MVVDIEMYDLFYFIQDYLVDGLREGAGAPAPGQKVPTIGSRGPRNHI